MKNRLLTAFLTLLVAPAVWAIDLDQFLLEVQNKNKIFKSLEAAKEASGAKKLAGDTALMPVLTAKGSWLTDRNPKTYTPTLVQTGLEGNEYSLGLAKKFSSGTAVSATATVGEGEAEINNATKTKQGTGSIGVALSQSLWKDSFGAGTRLRWEREAYIESLEKTGLYLQGQALLIDAEAAYWDYLYLREELKIRKASLERAQRLTSWMNKRVVSGIAERSDLVQIEALRASRELQLSMSEDEFKAAQKKMLDLLELSEGSELPSLEGKIDQARTVTRLVGRSGRNTPDRSVGIVTWDAYLSVIEAKVKKVVAQEAQDGLKADLQLKAAYATHSYGSTMSEAQADISKTNQATQVVSLEFTYLLDSDTKGSVTNASRMEATSTQLKAERKILEGKTQWSELVRRLSEMDNRIKSATTVSRLQTERAKLEQEKLSKGRTVTSQVIAAEQDAAEAELTVTKMKAEQRKIESRARMFVVIEEEI